MGVIQFPAFIAGENILAGDLLLCSARVFYVGREWF